MDGMIFIKDIWRCFDNKINGHKDTMKSKWQYRHRRVQVNLSNEL